MLQSTPVLYCSVLVFGRVILFRGRLTQCFLLPVGFPLSLCQVSCFLSSLSLYAVRHSFLFHGSRVCVVSLCPKILLTSGQTLEGGFYKHETLYDVYGFLLSSVVSAG